MNARHLIPRIAFAVAAAMLLAGCISVSEAGAFRGFNTVGLDDIPGFAPARTDAWLQNTTLDEYHLDAGDKLRVTVFGQPDLTGEFNVDGSGLVAVPLIPPVPARGLTTAEFARSLESVLGQRLLRNPSVSVEVAQYRPFFILGEVNQPGQYPYVNGMTVKTAAAIAGGFTYRASTSEVKITRRSDYGSMEGTATPDAAVMPGDTIFVDERLF
jgi:polysaccharide export outer membrane protein